MISVLKMDTDMTFVKHFFQVRHVVAAFMALKGMGGLLLVFGSMTGAVLLVRNFSLLESTDTFV